MLCILVLSFLWVYSLRAAPAANDLLRACESSLKNGFHGVEGELCYWYVTPCDCDYRKSPELPRVCLPKSIPTETLARTVIEGLKEQPELQSKEADYAAAVILSRIYPCTE